MTTKADEHVIDLVSVPITGIRMDGSGSGIDLQGTVITNSGTPSLGTDVVNINYVTSAIAALGSDYVNVTGDTMSGGLTINAGGLTVTAGGLVVNAGDAVVKGLLTIQSASATDTLIFNEGGGDVSVGPDIHTPASSPGMVIAADNEISMIYNADGVGTVSTFDVRTGGTSTVTSTNMFRIDSLGSIFTYGPNIEMGFLNAADKNCHIDMHSAPASHTNYTARIIRWSGANGNMNIDNKGTGVINFQLNTGNRLQIASTYISMGSTRVVNVGNAAFGTDAVNLNQLNSASGNPVLIGPVNVLTGFTGTVGWTTYTGLSATLTGKKAVILEAEGFMFGPDSGDTRAHIRVKAQGEGAGNAHLMLALAASGSNDSTGGNNTGIFNLNSGNGRFDYTVEAPGFNNGCSLWVVGYIE